MTAIDLIKEEFAKHVSANTRAVQFFPSEAAAADMGRLIRSLEQKRQLGQLTDQEQELLRSRDRLMENINYYNRQALAGTANTQTGQPNVYQLRTGKLGAEENEQRKFEMPRISQAEADKIISVINQQFEEKVLRNLRDRRGSEKAGALSIKPPILQDYLGKIKGRSYAR